MVRERLWDGAEAQPRTERPNVRRAADGMVTVSCATKGAVIGYRFGEEGPWSIYTEPFALPDDTWLTVVAHRIGHLPSKEVRMKTD